MRCFVLVWAVFLILAPAAEGETYVVNPEGTGDFPTIQAALDAIGDGDVIELSDGTFAGDGNRDLDYLGKAVTVRSQSGIAAACVIDCEGIPGDQHRGFWFHSGEGLQSLVEGITVTGGWAEGYPGGGFGGGIFCRGSSPTIRGCIFRGNSARTSGGAISCEDGASPELIDCSFVDNLSESAGGLYCWDHASPTLTGCVFLGNAAEMVGGGMSCSVNSSPVLTGCTFSGNSADWGGGGVYCLLLCFPDLVGCTLSGNGAPRGGGICCSEESFVTLENTIIAFSTLGAAVYRHDLASVAVLTCCDLYGNAGGDWVDFIAGQYGIEGNISEDPLFCDPGIEDFTLHCNSPCAPFTPPNAECDLIGAWPVGCGGTRAAPVTWGKLKTLFRR